MISFYGSLVILEEAVYNTQLERYSVEYMACTCGIKDGCCHPRLMSRPRGALIVLWQRSYFGHWRPPAKSGVQHINNTNVSSALKPSAEDTDLALMEGRQIKWTGWSLMYYLAVWNIVRAWLWRYIYQRGAAKQKGDSKGGRGKGWPGTQSCLCGGWPLMDTDPTQKTNTTG